MKQTFKCPLEYQVEHKAKMIGNIPYCPIHGRLLYTDVPKETKRKALWRRLSITNAELRKFIKGIILD